MKASMGANLPVSMSKYPLIFRSHGNGLELEAYLKYGQLDESISPIGKKKVYLFIEPEK